MKLTTDQIQFRINELLKKLPKSDGDMIFYFSIIDGFIDYAAEGGAYDLADGVRQVFLDEQLGKEYLIMMLAGMILLDYKNEKLANEVAELVGAKRRINDKK